MIINYSIIALFLTLFCFAGKPGDFEILKATSQKWAGGTAASGRGINYKFEIKPNYPSTKLKIDRLWIGEKYYEIKVTKKSYKNPGEDFSKGDTVLITARDYFPSARTMPATENAKSDTVKTEPLPYKYKGAALIGYKVGKKQKYKVVEKIEPIKQLMYP